MILYLRYARDLAQDGQLKVAREITLETVGHVSMEDPEPHFLLGQIAIAMEDQVLLHEAKNYLQYFKHSTWERKLDEIVKIGYPEFSCTGP